MTILWRKLSRNAKAYHGLAWTHPTFVEKTFVGGYKTAKFVNVFSLENFALYSIYIPVYTCRCESYRCQSVFPALSCSNADTTHGESIPNCIVRANGTGALFVYFVHPTLVMQLK